MATVRWKAPATGADSAIAWSFADISSLGLGASLTLAGPDGQLNGGETFTISGAGAPVVLNNTWDGDVSAPLEPALTSGQTHGLELRMHIEL